MAVNVKRILYSEAHPNPVDGKSSAALLRPVAPLHLKRVQLLDNGVKSLVSFRQLFTIFITFYNHVRKWSRDKNKFVFTT